MTASRPLTDALLVALIHQQALIDVGNRNVVLGVVRPLPHIQRPRAVEDDLAAQRRPHPPRRRLDVTAVRDHLRIVTTDSHM
jgi:hypothetical protein